jgi:multidrug transporter EmrE-like cation transporter
MALGAGCSNALLGVFAKQAQRQACRPEVIPVLMLGTVALVSAAAVPWAPGSWGDPVLWGLAAAMGLLYVAALHAMLVANRTCPPSLVWALANLALVVPVVAAPLFLDEPWQGLDGLLIAAFVAMLACFRRGLAHSGEATRAPWAQVRWPLAAVFLTNGLLMLGYKLEVRYWPEVGAVPFLVMTFGSGALLGLVARYRATAAIRRAEWRWGLGMGLAATVANLCILGAVVLPAAVAFPLVQGTGLVGGTVLMVWHFREPMNRAKWLGLACGLLVLGLAMFR